MERSTSYSWKMRDGKLFVNPLHLPVEGTRLSAVKWGVFCLLYYLISQLLVLNSDNPNDVFRSGRKVEMAYTEFLYALIICPVTQVINTSLVNCNCIRVSSFCETDNTRYFATKYLCPKRRQIAATFASWNSFTDEINFLQNIPISCNGKLQVYKKKRFSCRMPVCSRWVATSIWDCLWVWIICYNGVLWR